MDRVRGRPEWLADVEATIIVNPLRDLDFYLERKEKKFMWILEFQGKVSVLSLVWR